MKLPLQLQVEEKQQQQKVWIKKNLYPEKVYQYLLQYLSSDGYVKQCGLLRRRDIFIFRWWQKQSALTRLQ